MDPDSAEKVLASELRMAQKQVQVDKITEMGNTVLVEGTLQLAFVLQKGGDGQWHMVKIRRSSDHWETPDLFFAPSNESALSRSLEHAMLTALKSTP